MKDDLQLHQVKVSDEIEPITNLWSGYWDIALGCLLSSTTGYTDYSGEVSDGTDINYLDVGELESGLTVYVGFATPAHGINIRIAGGYNNNDTDNYINIHYWSGNKNNWTPISGTTTDGTSGTTTGSTPHISLYQTGAIQWDGTLTDEQSRILGGINTPLFWYGLTWKYDMPDDIRIWEINCAEKPENNYTFPEYGGVFEYNGRAMFWPGDKYKHGLDFSQDGYPHIFNGPKAGSTGNIFGPGIPNAAARIASYGIISTRDPYRLYLLQGKVPGRFDEYCISHHVGCVAPHTLKVIEDGIPKIGAPK